MTPMEAYKAYIVQWSPPRGHRLHFYARGWTPLTRTQFEAECAAWDMEPLRLLTRLLLEEGRS